MKAQHTTELTELRRDHKKDLKQKMEALKDEHKGEIKEFKDQVKELKDQHKGAITELKQEHKRKMDLAKDAAPKAAGPSIAALQETLRQTQALLEQERLNASALAGTRKRGQPSAPDEQPCAKCPRLGSELEFVKQKFDAQAVQHAAQAVQHAQTFGNLTARLEASELNVVKLTAASTVMERVMDSLLSRRS